MSYQVLARKYRPVNFDDVIGQEHITDLLKKAIKNNRVAHAYLFCGPRGIGKTTCARILAMCLNAEGGSSLKPAKDNPLCQDIIRGNSLDVIEIDGASNRGIDEIRSLRENVKFAPSYGRFKIYIVDEVHMLTMEAFNALLKTLEEPPEHVKFIFATTEPNKVPATIISRTQRFDFKRIPIPLIIDTLKTIAKTEKLKFDDDALYAIAKAADGSLRDALSVLDQMSALSERNIKTEDVYSMLGLVETQYLFDMTDAIAQKDCPGVLKILEEIVNKGKDVKQLMKDLTEHFRHLMIIKVGGKALGKLVDYPIVNKEMLLTQCQSLGLRDILTAIDALIAAQETSRITETQRLPLELALAKLTYQGGALDKPDAPEPNKNHTVNASKGTLKNKIDNAPVDQNKLKRSKTYDKEQNETTMKVETLSEGQGEVSCDIDKIIRLWDRLTHSVSKEKMSLATFLQDAQPVAYNKKAIIIGFPKSCKFQKESLETAENTALIEKVFSQVLKIDTHIKFEIIDDFKPSDEEPAIKSVLDSFGGKVINRWHND